MGTIYWEFLLLQLHQHEWGISTKAELLGFEQKDFWWNVPYIFIMSIALHSVYDSLLSVIWEHSWDLFFYFFEFCKWNE